MDIICDKCKSDNVDHTAIDVIMGLDFYKCNECGHKFSERNLEYEEDE
ncbi:hypothetical protein [Vallitalea sp.]|nr:hypothetical protein [Vallitalea sp.]MCT4686062.1 hypothetical protein [Vallitalea sp.]